ncbi:hypothetical protein Adeg_1366 [Ammonifex degensii KC4]|uniref:Uncharacterized protein n=1 Tax=Ammonifex degensii (strain DSM 10501 / KC4) TaxID=429009 RepID=C9R839_AMMDK|nr:hypothetical protein [Ammonifex degensii]ACX52468.1 hypothetical protein Adeg_1366 [Ammonifex degensii KC4]
MRPELKELLLASMLGLLAGPVYWAAGPSRFLSWYACVLAAGVLSTAGWLKGLRPGKGAWLLWLLWPVLSGACAFFSLAVFGALRP